MCAKLRALEENEVDAISGAAGTLRTLVDGSVRLQIDFEPKDRAAVMQQFGSPGQPVAVVALKQGFAAVPAKAADSRGETCMRAIGLCNNEDFQAYVADKAKWASNPKDFILRHCGVDSRKDLDASVEAQRAFNSVERDFRQWALREGR